MSRELRSIAQLARAVAHAGEASAIYEAALDALGQALGADRSAVLLRDADGIARFKAWRGLSEAYREAVTGHFPWPPDAIDPEPILVPDASGDPSLRDFQPLFRTEGISALAFVPLASRGRLLGKFMVYYDRPHEFPDEEVLVACTIAHHVAFALERTVADAERVKLLEREQAAGAEAEAARRSATFLAEAGARLAASLDYEATLADLARLAVPELADFCVVNVLDRDDRIRRVAIVHADPAREPLARELTRHVPPPDGTHPLLTALRTGRPVLDPVVTEEVLAASAQSPEHLAVLRALRVGSVMIVPLVARGRTLGAISFVHAESGRRYGAADLALAEELIRRAALAVDNARLYTEAEGARRLYQARARQQAAVAALGQRALAGGALYPLFEQAARLVAETLEIEFAKVLELLPDGREALLRAGVGWRPGLAGEARESAGRESPAGYTLLAGTPVVVDDLRIETRFARPALLLEHGVVSGATVMVAGRPQPFGVLGAYTTRCRAFTADDIHFLQAVANVLAAAVERRRAEDERRDLLARERAARAEAEAAVAARDAFLARASHELRTPLTSAIGTVRLLKRAASGTLKESPEALMEIASRNLSAMLALINNLLDASKLAAGGEPLALETLPAAALVAESVEVVGAQAREKGLRLESAVPPELRVTADPVKLEQVLVNLLANAVKFTPAGGIVTVDGESRGGEVVLRVRDNGEGILAQDLERIFEPFFQVDQAGRRRQRGTGLGLAICRQIVSLHGGTIEAQSEGPGSGSTFVVRLPAARAKSRAA